MCEHLFTSVLTGNTTTDNNMGRRSTAKGKGKAKAAHKFYGPPSPPPAIPLPPLPDTKPASGRMTNAFAAQSRLRTQNELLKQGQQVRPPTTPPNTPVKPGSRQSTASNSPNGSLKSALKKSPAGPSQTLNHKERMVHFDLETSPIAIPSSSSSPDSNSIRSSYGDSVYSSSYSRYQRSTGSSYCASSALDLMWPTAPTHPADAFNEPRSPDQSCSIHFFPTRYLRNEEPYAEGMTLPNGKAPTLDDTPAPWSFPTVRALPAIAPPSNRDAETLLRRERKRSYRRLVKHPRAGHRQRSAVQFHPRRLDGICEQYVVGHVTKVPARRFTGLSADFATMKTWL